MPDALPAHGWWWLAGSVALAVGSRQLAWRLRGAERRPPRLAGILAWAGNPAVLPWLRGLYYIGLPFGALVWGRDAVIGRLLGLQPLAVLGAFVGRPAPAVELAANWSDWSGDVGWAVVLGLAAWVVLAAGQRAVHRAAGGAQVLHGSASALVLLREAVYREVHWSFYRNAPVVAVAGNVGMGSGLYWGTWIGLALVLGEAALNPRWRADLLSTDRAAELLTRGGLAVLSAVAFLQTENLWLLVLTHWLVRCGIAGWGRRG